MNRKTKYMLTGALLVGGALVGIDLLRQLLSKKSSGEKLNWNNIDKGSITTMAFLGIGFGALAGYGAYTYQTRKEQEAFFCPDEYLDEILYNEDLRSDPLMLKAFLQKKDEIKKMLWNKLESALCSYPKDAGSFSKRTANLSNHDLDVVVPFRKGSVVSLKEMHEQTFHVVNDIYGATAQVIRKGSAIKIIFEEGGKRLRFDILPGREINDFQKDNDLNVYIRPDFFWQRGSSFKINLQQQRKITINNPKARRVVRLLKKYKDCNNISLKPVAIEQLTVEAMSPMNYGTYESDTENLLNSLDYITKKLGQKTLVDKMNSNNDFYEEITDWEKQRVSDLMSDDLKEIDINPAYLKRIF